MSGRLFVGALCLLAAGASAQPSPQAVARVAELSEASLNAPDPARKRALAQEALALSQVSVNGGSATRTDRADGPESMRMSIA